VYEKERVEQWARRESGRGRRSRALGGEAVAGSRGGVVLYGSSNMGKRPFLLVSSRPVFACGKTAAGSVRLECTSGSYLSSKRRVLSPARNATLSRLGRVSCRKNYSLNTIRDRRNLVTT
jgi:hypothetical protein